MKSSLCDTVCRRHLRRHSMENLQFVKTMIVVLAAGMSLFAKVPPAQGTYLSENNLKDCVETGRFSNNLRSLHDRLEEKLGLSFEIVYLQDIFWNTRGGMHTGDTGEYPRLISLSLELDTGKAGLWKNGTFFVSFEHHSGGSPTEHAVGDWQTLDNIDADRLNQVSEFWYKHSFLNNKLWLKLGKMEANADFSYIETGDEFINSSAGLIPTIPVPSYPDQDWGAVIGVEPVDWFSCTFGIYQGDSDGSRSVGNTLGNLQGPLLIVEPSFKYGLGGLPGSFNVGAWWNGRSFEAYHKHPSTQDTFGKAWGGYAFWQQQLWAENPDRQDCKQGISLFAQYGWAQKDRTEIEDFAGGGMRWTGAIPTRDNDSLGFGAFHARFSDRAGYAESAETAIEFYYRVQLTDWLALQPDMQYIVNPGGDSNRNAVAVGGRMEFVF